MTTQTTGWKSAFQAFLDRRALIMLFLGFSAGVPILLIFSSLSLWLGEAGVARSAVTFFSWAALGYSFKFVWAPLVDELPVPILTKRLGRRRAWLLIAQILIICAIVIMACANPALGQAHLYQMAVGAVLLGFSAATQDIVIDAYRIELAETQLQTVLASTYNAGYRIGMIVAGAGALFLAAHLGTAKGNYIYEAWQWTYLAMAGIMCIGIITTLVIREPVVERVRKHYQSSDYYRLVAVFFVAVTSFVLSYIYSGQLTQWFKNALDLQDSLLLFVLEALRFIGSAVVAGLIGTLLVKLGAVNRQMAFETWVHPVADFFKRYGMKLALVLLLLIGFYRISDIIAGVISNVFYQDLNFTKEQIAEAVKVYGVIFSLLGGFLGGLLAQKMNIMKLMFVGAILASSTNLIFVGLVKSGEKLDDVTLYVGTQQYQVTPDEVGYWSINLPRQQLLADDHIQLQTQFLHSEQQVRVSLPYLNRQHTETVFNIFPITSDNVITQAENQGSIVVRGQYFGYLSPQQQLILRVGAEQFPVQLDDSGVWSVGVPAALLVQQVKHPLTLQLTEHKKVVEQIHHHYQFDQHSKHIAALDLQVEPLAIVDRDDATMVEVKGKVIKQYSTLWLYAAIIIDNLASGLAGAAFIAFLSSLTSVSFTAVQYAIFSSLMTLTPKILGGYSGTIVNHVGYPNFFFMTTLIGIPILILVLWVGKLLKAHDQTQLQQQGE